MPSERRRFLLQYATEIQGSGGLILMISLPEAASVAAILSNATGIVDKIYGRFFEVKKGSPPPHEFDPARSAVIENHPDRGALVESQNGVEISKVTYPELSQRLAPDDLRYIKARENTMELLFQQWEGAYPALALESDPLRKVQQQQRLKGVTDDLGRELGSVLDFIENKAKLYLDDHYNAFRDLTGR
jgi:hypothetical protein